MLKADIVLKSKLIFDSLAEKPYEGAIAIKGNRIVAVCKDEGANEYIGKDTKVVNY